MFTFEACAAQHRLQLLADALATQFSESHASTACAATLGRLLPSLRYLSIALSSSAQGSALVASSNGATAGPTTLHLHDPLHSAAGRALALGKPLQTSLLNGGAAVLPAWTDVQQMVASEPAVSHLLCIPFGCGSGGEEGGSNGSTSCTQQQGSGRGALLFGFSAAPELDPRRKALLAGLAQCLPAPMARLSADTLAFVNFACGGNAECTCCCCAEEDGDDDDDEEEEEEMGGPASPCQEDNPGAGGSGGAAPAQPLPMPFPGEGVGPGIQLHSCKARSPASSSETVRPVASSASAAGSGTAGAPTLVRLSEGGWDGPRFSKGLLAAYAEQGEVLLRQHRVTLVFSSEAAEHEYAAWLSGQQMKGDLLFFMLLLAAVAIVCAQPILVVERGPIVLALCLGTALSILYSSWQVSAAAIAWREAVAAGVRVLAVACVNVICVRALQPHLQPHRMQQWVCFWRVTRAEGLAVMALGLRVRMRLHLALQAATLAVAVSHAPGMCSACYPGAVAGACFRSSAVTAALFGYVLPTAGLRYIEQRSRAAFASLLRSAAALQHPSQHMLSATSLR